MLSRRGYGSVRELMAMDTPEFLDILETEQIAQDIERYAIQQAREG